MPQAYTDIQLLFTHSIGLWTRSRAPICSLCLRLLLRVQLALRLTLIPPHYVGGSHGEVSFSFYRRPSTTTNTITTASSVSANIGPTNTTMPTLSKALEGLGGVPVRTFTTIKNMQEAINSYQKNLEASEASPYLIFRLVLFHHAHAHVLVESGRRTTSSMQDALGYFYLFCPSSRVTTLMRKPENLQ